MRLLSTNPNEPGVFAVGQEAVGIFALGQAALGVVAIGQVSRGIIAVGQLSVGVVAIGQLSLGLWRSVGMLAFGGFRVAGLLAIGGNAPKGLGKVPLLPRFVPEKTVVFPAETEVSALLSGDVERGWVRAKLRSSEGAPVLSGDPMDTSAVEGVLRRGLALGHDDAIVCLCGVVEDAPDYRQAVTRKLVAEDAKTRPTHPPRHLRYGESGSPATPLGVILRSLVMLAIVVGWALVTSTMWPILAALLD